MANWYPNYVAAYRKNYAAALSKQAAAKASGKKQKFYWQASSGASHAPKYARTDDIYASPAASTAGLDYNPDIGHQDVWNYDARYGHVVDYVGPPGTGWVPAGISPQELIAPLQQLETWVEPELANPEWFGPAEELVPYLAPAGELMPWVGIFGLALLMYWSYSSSTQPGLVPPVAPTDGSGGGAILPDGWRVDIECFRGGNFGIYNVPPGGGCYTYGWPEVPVPFDWGTATADPSQRVEWCDAPVRVGDLWEVNSNETWRYVGDPALYPGPAPDVDPGTDSSPGQQPFVAPITAPYPGVNPMVLPSFFPGVTIPGQTVQPVPWPSIKEFDDASIDEIPQVQRQVGPLANPGDQPWGVPDVSPAGQPEPGDEYEPELGRWVPPVEAPYAPPGVDLSAPSPFGAPPGVPGGPVDVGVGPDGIGYVAPTSPFIPYRRPAKGRRDKKLRGSTHAIRVLLAASTYGGMFIRSLFKSLPADVQRKAGHRYSAMLSAIWSNLDQVNWDKALILATEGVVKYYVEGRVLRTINRSQIPKPTNTWAPSEDWSSGYGIATNLYHAYGPDPYGGYRAYDSLQGGAFRGRQDPFGVIGEAINYANSYMW